MNWKEFINKTLELMGHTEWSVEIDEESKKGSIFIHDSPSLIKEHLPILVKNLNHLFHLIAKKQNQPPIFFDINNYRKEREKLIVELARAAARKVVATQDDIALPAMNAYERRIVHLELAMHPDIVTESEGSGSARHVVIKLIKTAKKQN